MTKYIVEVDKYGTRRWYNESKQLHRTDGPAVEFPNGSKSWYLNGVLITENEFLIWQQYKKEIKKASCEGIEVEIDGVKYKLVKA